ncbi:MAG TPA: DUF72 domain-containing protein [Candidatus Acidoferrales bacterium]|nr:DUF72 domain-containing protein [Candidatus Acidoferrales bacterium]
MAVPERSIRVGPAGWSYEDWNGIVYPSRRPRDFHEATYLAAYFDTIELNVTFYRPVPAHTAQQWIERVAANPHFLFTAKLWQQFTHESELTAANEREARPALEVLREAGKLGAVLAQFPWSFKNTAENRAYVEKLAKHFRDFPLVVEVRHASWNQREFYDWLAEHRVGFCNIDQPVIGRSLKPSQRAISQSGIGYVRLHGRNYEEWFRPPDSGKREDASGGSPDSGSPDSGERYNYLYSIEELEPWAGRIQAVAESAPLTFVITNNHFHGKAVTNALQLIHLLTRQPVKVPPPLLTHYPELESIASPAGTTPSLFKSPRE